MPNETWQFRKEPTVRHETASNRRKAVFLDKDGTLIENVPYNVDPARIRLAYGAAQSVDSLAREGYRLIVVSNQPGAALGLFSEDALAGVKKQIEALLALPLHGFYYC